MTQQWLDRLVGACVGVFVGALALYGAVWLLRAICFELVLVGSMGAGIAVLVGWWRSRW